MLIGVNVDGGKASDVRPDSAILSVQSTELTDCSVTRWPLCLCHGPTACVRPARSVEINPRPITAALSLCVCVCVWSSIGVHSAPASVSSHPHCIASHCFAPRLRNHLPTASTSCAGAAAGTSTSHHTAPHADRQQSNAAAPYMHIRQRQRRHVDFSSFA